MEITGFKGTGGGGGVDRRPGEGQNRVVLLFLIEGSVSYQMLFIGSKKMVLAEVIGFKILKIRVITVCANFKGDFPKMDIFRI